MLASSGPRGSSASDPKTSEGYVARYLLLAVTLPSTGPRESSSSDPKTGEGGNLLCSLPLTSMFLLPCLCAPSATVPKVVSPTAAILWGAFKDHLSTSELRGLKLIKVNRVFHVVDLVRKRDNKRAE